MTRSKKPSYKELRMKKYLLLPIFLILAFALTACGATAETETVTAASTDGTEIVNFQFEMPTEMTLMVGTVKLDETAYAVDAQQASALIPLWKALRSLSESDTAAEAEIEAVINQITETMTLEQMQAISDMDLTMQDFASVAEILGLEMSGFGGGNFGEITPEMQATREAMRDSGEFPGPGGGMGLGGGQGPGGGFGSSTEMDPAARETAIAERGGMRGAGLGISSQLLDAIIEFLEAKTG
jgi:hypothetical protein